MIILGIETSCDETAAAIVEDLPAGRQVELQVLSNITATSAGLHARTGGIIPEEAARKQLEVIMPVVNLALKDAGVTRDDIDSIAVTFGPGLIGSLLVGVETAKTLAYVWNKSIIPVNHLVAHIYANWLSPERESGRVEEHKSPKFPALALVVSGGHTDLVLIKNHNDLEWVGGTRDDAAGEAFDKTARLLAIPYPGGPLLAKTADEFIERNPNVKLNLFPRPMIGSDDFDWSFSGLKTAVLNHVIDISKADGFDKNLKLSDYKTLSANPKIKKLAPEIAAEVQEAIVDVLVAKSIKAVKKFKPKSFILSGGVSANKRLAEKFRSEFKRKKIKTKLYVPNPKLSTDNAVAIAACAFFNNNPVDWDKISANPQLEIVNNK